METLSLLQGVIKLCFCHILIVASSLKKIIENSELLLCLATLFFKTFIVYTTLFFCGKNLKKVSLRAMNFWRENSNILGFLGAIMKIKDGNFGAKIQIFSNFWDLS